MAAAGVIAACSTIWGSTAEGGNSSASLGQKLIEPHFGTLLYTTITFILLAMLLGRFAWKPLLGALAAREATIRDSLDQARRERDEASRLLVEQRQLVDEARRERAEAVAAGRRDAEQIRAELVEEGRRQRDELLAQGRIQMEQAIRQARVELRGSVVDMAIRAAERLIERNLDDATQRRLVEEHVEDLARSGGSFRQLTS